MSEWAKTRPEALRDFSRAGVGLSPPGLGISRKRATSAEGAVELSLYTETAHPHTRLDLARRACK